jgi:hypothetical protein
VAEGRGGAQGGGHQQAFHVNLLYWRLIRYGGGLPRTILVASKR